MRTTSTNFITCAGLKKCKPTTRSACCVAPANSRMSIVDVLLHNSAVGESSGKTMVQNRRPGPAPSMAQDAPAVDAAVAQIYNEGLEAANNGDFQTAKTKFQEATKQAPGFVEAEIMTGREVRPTSNVS